MNRMRKIEERYVLPQSDTISFSLKNLKKKIGFGVEEYQRKDEKIWLATKYCQEYSESELTCGNFYFFSCFSSLLLFLLKIQKEFQK